MTRLFLRFFLGVIAILVSAWVIQLTVLRVGRARQTAEQIEKSLGGGAKLAGLQLLYGDVMEALTEDEMAELQKLLNGDAMETLTEYEMANLMVEVQELLDGDPMHGLTEEEIANRMTELQKLLNGDAMETLTEDEMANRMAEVQKLLNGDPMHTLTEEQIANRMDALQQNFDYPVKLIQWWKLSLSRRERERLERGETILTGSGMLVARLNQEHVTRFGMFPEIDGADERPFRLSYDYVLRFGPLPTFQGPSQREMMLSLGLVMLMAAIGIAILLRPIALPLRDVERTATAISEGDLSARINPDHVPKGLALATAFNTMAERTETLLRSQKQLLEAVSHELRTPLARIRFATDLIETAKSDEERKIRLKSVDSATERLDELVGELLTYVRLESDSPDDEHEPIELNALFEQLIDIHAPLHQGIDFDIDRVLPYIQVTADRRSIARAVGNLISNAGRYAKSRVAVRAIQRRDGVMIQVDDDGVGVPEEDREKVFDPFVRLTPNDGKGTGLGLALVNRIVDRYGGTVTVEQSEMGGARFSFYLPHVSI